MVAELVSAQWVLNVSSGSQGGGLKEASCYVDRIAIKVQKTR